MKREGREVIRSKRPIFREYEDFRELVGHVVETPEGREIIKIGEEPEYLEVEKEKALFPVEEREFNPDWEQEERIPIRCIAPSSSDLVENGDFYREYCNEIIILKEGECFNFDTFNISKERMLDRKSVRQNLIKYLLLNAPFLSPSCQDSRCENKADLYLLPSLELHHLDPKKKDITFSKLNLSFKNFDKILESLKYEDLFCLCRNCHTRVHSDIYREFKDFLTSRSISSLSPTEIQKSIEQLVFDFENKSYYLYEIKKWLKKRFIIEFLFDGKCVGCEEVDIYNNLPSLSFHHRDPSLKIKTWSEDLKSLSITEISDIIRREDMICLCRNCHVFVESNRFTKLTNVKELLSELKSRKIISNEQETYYSVKISSHFNKLTSNIKNFKHNTKKIKDPLLLVFHKHRGDKWKEYLVYAYLIIEEKGENIFTSKELAYSLDLDSISRKKRSPLKQLINLGYFVLQDVDEFEYKYYLSNKGVLKAKEILKNLYKKNPLLYKELKQNFKLLLSFDFKIKHKNLRDFLSSRISIGEGWKEYLIHLFFIMKAKKKNKVKSSELLDSLDKNVSLWVIRSPINDLIKKKYIIVKKSHSSKPSEFILTKSGIAKSKEIQKELMNYIDFSIHSKGLRNSINNKLPRQDYLEKHLMHIIFIVDSKNENNFSWVELSDSLGYRQIQSKVKLELLKKGYVVKASKKIGRTIFLKLTQKGRSYGIKLFKKYNLDTHCGMQL